MNVFEMRENVSKQQIHELVHAFYRRVRQDADLGPIFATAIADADWPAHLERMVAFWSTVLHGQREYFGNPMIAHAGVPGLHGRHFDRWLELFGESADEIFDAPVASSILQRATRMGAGLRTALGTPAA